jgi:hypothetical protein
MNNKMKIDKIDRKLFVHIFIKNIYIDSTFKLYIWFFILLYLDLIIDDYFLFLINSNISKIILSIICRFFWIIHSPILIINIYYLNYYQIYLYFLFLCIHSWKYFLIDHLLQKYQSLITSKLYNYKKLNCPTSENNVKGYYIFNLDLIISIIAMCALRVFNIKNKRKHRIKKYN